MRRRINVVKGFSLFSSSMLNANAFLSPLFATNTFFLYVNPLAFACAWCNGRYFLCSVASPRCFRIKSIFISDFSCNVTGRFQVAIREKEKIPARKSSGRFPDAAHAICCLAALNEGKSLASICLKYLWEMT